jgi:putative membrane protein
VAAWLKALHLIAMVAWFAGLFYLPRLFVYHAQTEDTPGRERFKTMERKLYRGIMTPAAVLTVVFGLALIGQHGLAFLLASRWLQWKLLLVAGLLVYHLLCGRWLAAFARDEARHSHVFYRWINEIPVLFLIAIVLLAVLRP